MPGEELTDEQKEEVRKQSADKYQADEQREKEKLQSEIEEKRAKVVMLREKLMTTRIVPEEDRLVVWPDPIELVTGGGIILPDEAIKKAEQATLMGTVLAVGPGKTVQQNLTNRLLLAILKVVGIISKTASEAYDQLKIEVAVAEEIPLKPGDHIMYGKFAGTQVQDPDTKETLLIMRPNDVFAKIR